MIQINDYLYDGKAILVAGNGSYTGRTRFYEGKFDLYQRTYAVTTEAKDFIEYLYWTFKIDFEAKYSGGTRGATNCRFLRARSRDCSRATGVRKQLAASNGANSGTAKSPAPHLAATARKNMAIEEEKFVKFIIVYCFYTHFYIKLCTKAI